MDSQQLHRQSVNKYTNSCYTYTHNNKLAVKAYYRQSKLIIGSQQLHITTSLL